MAPSAPIASTDGMAAAAPAAVDRGHGLSGWIWVLGAAWAVGIVLRLWGLPDQILGGDEMHSVRALGRLSLREILTTYEVADYCIPLTALARLLGSWGVPMSELSLRLPSVIAGIALVILMPWCLRFRLPGATVAAFACALALSPALVFYARVARPYALATLLVALGALAFERYWRTGARRAAAGFALAAGVAAWFLLPAAPAAAAPLLAACFAVAFRQSSGGRAAAVRIAMAGSALAAVVGLWMLPTLPSFVALLELKRVRQDVPVATWIEALTLLSGTTQWLAAAGFWAAALAGWGVLRGQDRVLAWGSATVVIAQAVAIRVLSPMGLANPLVLMRYLLPVLPCVLLWLACALALPWRTAATGRPAGVWRWLPRVLSGLAVAAWILCGPLVDPARWRGSFAGHDDYLRFTRPRAGLPAARVPTIYRELDRSSDGGAGAVVEAPWPSSWASRVPYIGQEIHRREVLLAIPDRTARDPGAKWRNFVPLEPETVRASRARFLVVHLDPLAEEARVTRAGVPDPAEFAVGYRQVLAEMPRFLRRLQRVLGPPIADDGIVRVWDLEAARAREQARRERRAEREARKSGREKGEKK